MIPVLVRKGTKQPHHLDPWDGQIKKGLRIIGSIGHWTAMWNFDHLKYFYYREYKGMSPREATKTPIPKQWNDFEFKDAKYFIGGIDSFAHMSGIPITIPSETEIVWAE